MDSSPACKPHQRRETKRATHTTAQRRRGRGKGNRKGLVLGTLRVKWCNMLFSSSSPSPRETGGLDCQSGREAGLERGNREGRSFPIRVVLPVGTYTTLLRKWAYKSRRQKENEEEEKMGTKHVHTANVMRARKQGPCSCTHTACLLACLRGLALSSRPLQGPSPRHVGTTCILPNLALHELGTLR